MAIKTTSTTDNSAGCSPCTPEASKGQTVENSQTEAFVTCHGCIHLDSKDCWCNYHWQHRVGVGVVRTCEGAQFFED